VSSALRRFGILECVACGEPHEFVSYSPSCEHITDAFCCECGFTYGRKDETVLPLPPLTGARGAPPARIEQRKVPVVSNAEAIRALARLQARHPGAAFAGATAALGPPSPAAAVADDPPVPEADSLRSPPLGTSAGRVPDFVGPRPAGPEENDEDAVEDDGSRRAAFLRSLGVQWQSQKSP
jgi:hypothetical protein